MKMIKTLSTATLLLAALNVYAEQERSLSYSYLDVSYGQAKITDGDKIKADGAGIGGSFEVGSNVFLTLGYSSLETEKVYFWDGISIYSGTVESTSLSAGIGGFIPLNDNVDFVGEFSFVRGEYKYKGEFSFLGKESDNGWGAGIGIRSMLSSWFELSGGIRHFDIFEDSDTAFVLAARAHFSKLFSLGLSYTKYSDENQVSFSARFSF